MAIKAGMRELIETAATKGIAAPMLETSPTYDLTSDDFASLSEIIARKHSSVRRAKPSSPALLPKEKGDSFPEYLT